LFPYTPIGAMFGFQTLPLYFFPLMALIVGMYILTAEAAKKIFYRRITF
jgi:Mg2+-importing ATPase